MRAAVIRQAGGPEVFGIERLPVPEPRPGEVLIRVRAFGLNRSELFTRRGDSPGVRFPRVLGGPVFPLEKIVDAHRCMERNEAGGKIVVLID